MPPRRMTSTKRLPPAPAAPASESVGQAPRAAERSAGEQPARDSGGVATASEAAAAAGSRRSGVATFMAMSSVVGVAQRRWNSGASSSRASACGPSAARSIWRAVSAPSSGPEALRGEPAGVDACAGAVGEPGRPLDPLPDRVGPEPVVAAIAPARGRRRRLDPLAEARSAAASPAAPLAGRLEHALAERAARAVETTNSSGVFSFAGAVLPRRVAADQLAIDLARAGRRSSGRSRPDGRRAPAAARRRRNGAPAWWRRSGPSRGAGRGRAAPA